MPDKKDPTQSLALIPRTADEVTTVVQQFARSSLIPEFFKKSKNPEADLYFTISYGMDMGFSPTQSLRAINVIQGKPGLYADAMVALVLSSGKAKYFRVAESTPEKVTYETCRVRSTKIARKTFTLKDAQRAQLGGSGGWKKYPQHMLEARAKSWLARDVYPDVLHGVYSAEELQELEPEPMAASDFSPVVDAAVVSEVAVEAPVEGTNAVVKTSEPGMVVLEPEVNKKPEPPEDLSTPIDFDIPDEEPTPEPEGDPSKPTLIEQIQQAEDIDALRAVGVLCADVTELDERNALRAAYAVRVKELS